MRILIYSMSNKSGFQYFRDLKAILFKEQI